MKSADPTASRHPNAVVMFTKTTCPHCVAAKTLLATKTHILPVRIVDVTVHPERRADLTSRGLTTVPQIFLPTGLVEGGNAALQQLERDGALDALLEVAAVADPVHGLPLPLDNNDGVLESAMASPTTDAVSDSESDWDDVDDEEDDKPAHLPTHPSGLPAVYIMHDNDAWTEPYRAAFEKAGVPFVEWCMGSGHVDTTRAPPAGVFFNRASASSHTRGDRWSMEHATSIVAWLEAHGRTVVGGSNALALEVSKSRQTVQLARDGVTSPHTEIVVGKRKLLQTIRRRLKSAPHGVIVKPNRGGSGAGVRLVRSAAHARAYARAGDFDGSLDGTMLVQDYVPGDLYRLEFVAGKFMYALAIRTPPPAPDATEEPADGDMSNCPLHDDAPAPTPSFENCPADACTLDDGAAGAEAPKFTVHTDFEHPVVAKLESFMRRQHLVVAGIEVVVDANGDAFVIDANVVNSNHNRAAEQRAGLHVSGVEHVARHLHQLLCESGEVGAECGCLPSVASRASLASSVSGGEADDDDRVDDGALSVPAAGFLVAAV